VNTTSDVFQFDFITRRLVFYCGRRCDVLNVESRRPALQSLVNHNEASYTNERRCTRPSPSHTPEISRCCSSRGGDVYEDNSAFWQVAESLPGCTSPHIWRQIRHVDQRSAVSAEYCTLVDRRRRDCMWLWLQLVRKSTHSSDVDLPVRCGDGGT